MPHAKFPNQNKEENITKVRDTKGENLNNYAFAYLQNICATLSFDYMAGCDNW